MLPERLIEPLRLHLEKVKAEGFGTVYLPYALERKYPNANANGPGNTSSRPPNAPSTHEAASSADITLIPPLQRAVNQALRAAGITKPGSCHSFRHSFATYLLEGGYDTRTTYKSSWGTRT